ncbi:unnamed protein product [Blepharisma stoltei]|uniref:RING-type domain-containing protein n=1 Tax=Blepharisma stoltei TaxID=1481888 RepID=A0AAU9IUA5_9CILI|nr:unnamed protein product [Blepharisma stoltei]
MTDNQDSLIIAGCLIVGLFFFVFLAIYIYCRRYFSRLKRLSRQFTANSAGPISSNISGPNQITSEITETMLNKKMPMLFYPIKKKFKGEPACTICLVDFKQGEVLRLTKCKHIFHVGCIDEWIISSSKKKCPNCNWQILR